MASVSETRPVDDWYPGRQTSRAAMEMAEQRTLRLPSLNQCLVAVLLLGVVSVPVYSARQAGWVEGTEVLWPVVLAGLAIGWASARLRTYVGLPLGLLGGLAYVFVEVGQVLPYPRLLNLTTTPIDLAWQLAGGPVLRVLPFTELEITRFLGQTGQNSLLFSMRLSLWSESALAGAASTDNLVFLGFLALTAWLVSFWAAWGIYRLQHPALALLPAAVAMVAVTINSKSGAPELIVFTTASLLLALRVNLSKMLSSWDRRGIDYSEEIEAEVGIVAVGVVAAVSVMAALLPTMSTNPASESFWTAFRQPWGEVENTVNRVFAGVQRTQMGGAERSDGVVLGGSIETTGQDVVFLVATDQPPPIAASAYGHIPMSDIPPPPKLYFRSLTFDVYGGLQWKRSEDVEREPFQANENLEPGPSSIQSLIIEQRYELVAPRSPVAMALNRPVSVDVPYEVLGLDEGIVAVSLDRVRSRYTVVSAVPQPTQRQLRQASLDYPSWTARYLELPPLPSRVIDLAVEITNGVTNPYDKARAIESYLRMMEYSGQVIPPPDGRDAVDYFLFDGRQGYCDYFASAMVIMLRAVDVPARLAIGYSVNDFDHERQVYVGRQKDAHSWPEVYFPDIGWVEFEPTPSNPLIDRPMDEADLREMLARQEMSAEQPQEEALQAGLSLSIWWLTPLGLAAFWYLFSRALSWWADRMPASDYVRTVFERLCLYAGWFGAARRPTQTAYEYGSELSERLKGPMGAAVTLICDTYVRTTYGRLQLSTRQRREFNRVWRRLRWRLWRLRWPEPGRVAETEAK